VLVHTRTPGTSYENKTDNSSATSTTEPTIYTDSRPVTALHFSDILYPVFTTSLSSSESTATAAPTASGGDALPSATGSPASTTQSAYPDDGITSQQSSGNFVPTSSASTSFGSVTALADVSTPSSESDGLIQISTSQGIGGLIVSGLGRTATPTSSQPPIATTTIASINVATDTSSTKQIEALPAFESVTLRTSPVPTTFPSAALQSPSSINPESGSQVGSQTQGTRPTGATVEVDTVSSPALQSISTTGISIPSLAPLLSAIQSIAYSGLTTSFGYKNDASNADGSPSTRPPDDKPTVSGQLVQGQTSASLLPQGSIGADLTASQSRTSIPSASRSKNVNSQSDMFTALTTVTISGTLETITTTGVVQSPVQTGNMSQTNPGAAIASIFAGGVDGLIDRVADSGSKAMLISLSLFLSWIGMF